MNTVSIKVSPSNHYEKRQSMQEFGEAFIQNLPKHIGRLRIPGRRISDDSRTNSLPAQIDGISEIQITLHEVLHHAITLQAQFHTEGTFKAFLGKDKVDNGLLCFFNGWNETHKTTSLVSNKVIMRLAADTLFLPTEQQSGYHRTLAHMSEVARDDFGLGQDGHDGMYNYLTGAFGAETWMQNQFQIYECSRFSDFLYQTGISGCKSAIDSNAYNQSIMDAMMVSIASELWNGQEYNFIAQFIEEKLLSFNPRLGKSDKDLRNAKGYIVCHSREVETRHGLHALAAAQAFGRTKGLPFKVSRLKEIMLDYNARVGSAFSSLYRALATSN